MSCVAFYAFVSCLVLPLPQLDKDPDARSVATGTVSIQGAFFYVPTNHSGSSLGLNSGLWSNCFVGLGFYHISHIKYYRVSHQNAAKAGHFAYILRPCTQPLHYMGKLRSLNALAHDWTWLDSVGVTAALERRYVTFRTSPGSMVADTLKVTLFGRKN